MTNFCRDCVHWKSNLKFTEEDYPRTKALKDGYWDGLCREIQYNIIINAVGGCWEGATVKSVETDANFGCVLFKAKE